MQLFTVYENPSDYPGKFVVREFNITAGEVYRKERPTIVTDTIEKARRAIPPGCVSIGRMQHDDPVIVEVWL